MEQIELGKILDNPYQPRTVDNAEHIQSLAKSIATDGLLQVPTARKMDDGTYQLAFGHSRRKAFEWLASADWWDANGLPERYEKYSVMPVNVETLTNEEMYRFAVAENVQRKDLDTLEVAKAMQRYGVEFNKTSKEIGELFGMNDATVRGKVRLLDLPAPLAEKLSSGEISEGLARLFLSLLKLGTVEDMLNALKEAREDPETEPGHAVESYIGRRDHVEDMWSDGKSGKPHSHWQNGWALDAKKFPNELMEALTYADVIKALRIEETPRLKKLSSGTLSFYELLEKLKETGDPEAARIEHLLNPPAACTTCPYYAKVNKTHYCGMKVCYERRTAAWNRHLFEKMSKALGISIYNAGTDGKYRLLNDDDIYERGLFTKRNKDLRLVPKSVIKSYQYQSFGHDSGFDSHFGWLVLTGNALAKRAQMKKEERLSEPVTVEADPDYQVEMILRQAREILSWAAATEVAKLFEGFTVAAIGHLFEAPYGWRKASFLEGEEPEEEHQQQLMWMARKIVDGYDDMNSAHPEPETAAQILENLTAHCKTMNVKLPKAMTKMAEQFDTQLAAVGVAVETED
jgi:ParB-like chromosome segregation protein Spo0J